MSTPSSSKPLPILKDVLFHTLSSEQCLKILETTISGLTKTEASTRLTTYGPNALTPSVTPLGYNIIITQDGIELAAQNDNILIT